MQFIRIPYKYTCPISHEWYCLCVYCHYLVPTVNFDLIISLVHLRYSFENISFISFSFIFSASKITRLLHPSRPIVLIPSPLPRFICSLLTGFPHFMIAMPHFFTPNSIPISCLITLTVDIRLSISVLFFANIFRSSIKNRWVTFTSPSCYILVRFETTINECSPRNSIHQFEYKH